MRLRSGQKSKKGNEDEDNINTDETSCAPPKPKKKNQKREAEWAEKYNARLCDDVFNNILCFGNRRHLGKLEPNGTRFQYFINRYMSEKPYLVFDVECSKYEKDKKEDLIYGVSITRPVRQPSKQMVFSLDHVISPVPAFLRIRNVLIDFAYCSKSKKMLSLDIDKRAEIYMPLLCQFVPALSGCSLTFHSVIKGLFGVIGFPDNAAHFEYIRDQLVPQLFDRCCSYKFETDIYFTRKSDSRSILLAELLAVEPVKRCRRVEIVSHSSGIYMCGGPPRDSESEEDEEEDNDEEWTQMLPISEISAWLHKPLEQNDGHERFLSISIGSTPIENIDEMISSLKKGFKDSKMPCHPFTLQLIEFRSSKKIVEEIIQNKNEQISIKFDCVNPKKGRTRAMRVIITPEVPKKTLIIKRGKIE